MYRSSAHFVSMDTWTHQYNIILARSLTFSQTSECLKSKQTKYSGFVKLGVRWAERDNKLVNIILYSQPSNHFKILSANNPLPLRFPFMKITMLIMVIHILVRIVKSRQLENSCMFILDYHTRRNLHYYILLHYCLYYQKKTIFRP